MGFRLRKPTEIKRATVDEQVRVILPPEPDVSPSVMRRVQVLVPGSPKVNVTVDKMPDDIGPNRAYKAPVFHPGTQILFHIGAEQWLVATAADSFAEVTVIVEYVEAT